MNLVLKIVDDINEYDIVFVIAKEAIKAMNGIDDIEDNLNAEVEIDVLKTIMLWIASMLK